MIEIRNLSKRFGQLHAVEDLSFQVAKGEVLGFLGPNGAGKSTTMKMLTGFLEPTSGNASVCGHDVQSEPLAVKRNIGYLPEGAPLYGDMTPRGFLQFIAEVRGIEKSQRKGRLDEVVDKVHIGGVMGQRIETLSKGFKRRVGLAQAILHDPPVLVLDEPTDGLDPNQKHDVRQLILEMAKDKCIVLSTHILEEVPAVCTRAILIANGRLCFDGTPEEMRKKSPSFGAISLQFGTQVAVTDLENLGGVQKASPGAVPNSFVLYPSGTSNALESVTQAANERNWDLTNVSVDGGHLDEVFRLITAGSK